MYFLFELHLGIYWVVSLCFYLFDLKCCYEGTSAKYKYIPISHGYEKYCRDSAKSALLNQILVTYPVIMYVNKYVVEGTGELLPEILKLVFYVICSDVWFFVLHYACHKIPYFYRYHKYHHRIFNTSAVSALDANILEHLFINLGSIAIGIMLWNPSVLTTQIWVALTTFSTCSSHSGYKLFSKKHNLHHQLLKCNYGQDTHILDRLFGTYKK